MANGELELFHAILAKRYPQRVPTESEVQFFEQNTNVSGMGADDKTVVLNPIAKMAPNAFAAVLKNERVRLFLDESKLNPPITISDKQREIAKSWGGPYSSDDSLLRKTIIARILSGDLSLGPYDASQLEWARRLVSRSVGKRPSG